jgi:molecular chaperone DnaK (HSP70)
LYFLMPEEQATGAMALPWNDRPDAVAGVFARDHGALVPTRQISSAKSWLSNAAVDRRAPLLPWAAEASPKISAVEASARLLSHLCDAWNHAHASGDERRRLQQLEVVLTVPASFDEEARELTVEAARQAGLEQLTLLEEPLAVVYAWMARHPRQLARTLGAGRLLLVCDVGGGTTDFSLIRASTQAGQIILERIAIGEHLLLGGDNVDVALAALAESKLVAAAPGGRRLDAVQRQALRRQCSTAKEQLLGDDAPERVAITVLGGGRTVVGGAMTTELTREEALAVLNEFLPLVAADERPQRQVRRGLRELGLPYESDPAVTRHLGAFLARAARISGDDTPDSSRAAIIRPDAVLFNGGFFTPPVARERILDALGSWFGARLSVLENEAPEAAVAIGAAFYAAIRRDAAASSRLLIRAGSARAYYVAVQSTDTAGITTTVCVMPRGTNEGTTVVLDREFTVIANQPAAFTLFSSAERSDGLNELVTFVEGDDVHRHAPLVTALRYGQRSRRVPLKVRLNVIFTEIGTLELWCESIATEHRWRLQFNLRAAESADGLIQAPPDDDPAGDQVVIADEAVGAAERLLRNAFSTPVAASRMDALLGELENLLGHGKQEWPLPVIRRLGDVLLQSADGRRLSARHEARWLNLAGFCMRPGFGTSLDPWRISELRKVYVSGLAYPKDVQCQVEWLILWQRVSAGFTASQQQELTNKLLGLLGLGTRKAPRLNIQMAREAWRLLASLERLDRAQRIRLGDELMTRLRRDSQNASFLWSAGRLGARIPLYGPLNSVVPPAVAERWLEALHALRAPAGEAIGAVAQIAARTNDPARDITDEARELTVQWLEAAGAPADIVRSLHHPVSFDLLSRSRTFGEALPEGLRLEDIGEAPKR